MRNINILYEFDYDDVDILLVPDSIANNIEDVVKEFNSWLLIPENCGRFLVSNADREKILGIDTQEFLWWLNHIKLVTEPKAVIIKQHTAYVESYPTAEF